MLRSHSALRLKRVAAAGCSRRHKTTAPASASAVVDPLSDDYQFLQQSKTPMLHFQPSLLRLPIPELDKTCDRYLAAQRPLLDDTAYAHCKQLTEHFRTVDGPPLQELLRANDKANKHTSYISQPWFETYLSDRRPLPINYNVSLVMKPDPRAAYNEPLLRTSNLVLSALRFRRSLRDHVLNPEVYHMNAKKSDTPTYHTLTRLAPAAVSTFVSMAFSAYPLDMSQYDGLFGATRIPQPERDVIQRVADTRHIVVLRAGHLFAVDVLDAEGNIEAPHVVQARLRHVHEQRLTAAADPVGVLTAAPRAQWAALRKRLEETGNADALATVDTALFCVCLDDEQRLDEANPVPLVLALSAGDGTNRWFDKSISLMIAGDGTAAVHFEHSWGDGVAVLRFFNEIFADSTEKPCLHPGDKHTAVEVPANAVRPLRFQLDAAVQQGIREARAAHALVMDSLTMDVCLYEHMNKRICKEFRLSPDSVMQLGFQLAFFKQTGGFGSTYESCSTAAFRHGRTETIRPCTVATRAFCEAISRPAAQRPSKAELRAMIDACSRTHGQLTKEAAMGQGFDRHLFGMRHMARVNGLPVPALYEDETYARINHNVMSTSTLSSPGLFAGAFGPVVPDGYGIG